MKDNIPKIINLKTVQDVKVEGNLALKNDSIFEGQPKNVIEYTKPRVLVLKPKRNHKIFCGCWQVANQEDAC